MRTVEQHLLWNSYVCVLWNSDDAGTVTMRTVEQS